MTSEFVKKYGISKRECAKIYRKAANLIDVYGLTKGRFGNYNEGFCAAGAIFAAAGDREREAPTMQPLRKLVGGSISYWNDAHNRTSSEVTSKLRQAAAKLEHGWSGV